MDYATYGTGAETLFFVHGWPDDGRVVCGESDLSISSRQTMFARSMNVFVTSPSRNDFLLAHATLSPAAVIVFLRSLLAPKYFFAMYMSHCRDEGVGLEGNRYGQGERELDIMRLDFCFRSHP